ncbi:hypothetical protein D3C86_1276000 [compost metagenome]
MQRLAGAGITKARPECAEETFRQCIIGVLCPWPPQKGGDNHEIAGDISAIGKGRPEGREQDAAGGRADGTGDVDAERVQRHGALDILTFHQLRHDGLPGRAHQRGADAAEEGETDQRANGQQAGLGQNHEGDADGGQQQLHGDQEFAAVENIGQHAGRNCQKKDRQRPCRLNHGDGRRRGRKIGHQP